MFSARSGLKTPAQEHEQVLAYTAAMLDHRAGRSWRSLQNTANAAQILYFAVPGEWRFYRRSVDFYPESMLIWLEVDTTIRKLTNDRRSMDDFCHMFYGGPTESPSSRLILSMTGRHARTVLRPTIGGASFASGSIRPARTRRSAELLVEAGGSSTATPQMSSFTRFKNRPAPGDFTSSIGMSVQARWFRGGRDSEYARIRKRPQPLLENHRHQWP